jgi:hypothetical protein
MAQPVIQHSFHAGEWAPALNARVDLAKYHAGAALLKNFFVDYRGGVSTRPGTRYVLTCKSLGSRLIPFIASSSVQYVLEFGQNYIRFYNNGAPILEAAQTIGSATSTTITITAHGYNNGDWIAINSKYYVVTNVAANTFQLNDLFGNAVNTAGFSGTAARVYTISSPYAIPDLPLVKYTQSVNSMILCHPNYAPQVLTINSGPTDWTIAPITFGSTVAIPTGLTIATSNAGAYNISYIVTAVDLNGQESGPSAVAATTVGTAGTPTVTLSWSVVPGAQSYNIYRSQTNTTAVLTASAVFGFIANQPGNTYYDAFNNGLSINGADFSQGFPIIENPFSGGAVNFVTLTTVGGNYTTVPTVAIAAPSSGMTATASAICKTNPSTSLGTGNSAWSAGSEVSDPTTGFRVHVDSTSAPTGSITGYHVVNPGTLSSGSLPATIQLNKPLGGGFFATQVFNVTWHVAAVNLIQGGTGYTAASPPAVTFTPNVGGTAATATVAAVTVGNPSVPAFYQERLAFGGAAGAPQTVYLSQPGSFYNFNVSSPIQDDDSITASIVGESLNTIKSMIAVPTGLIVFSDRKSWLLSGGASNAPITPADVNVAPQSFGGASDVPPIRANNDILFIQAKNSIVRYITFNFYTNVFTGTDISVLSSHLFYSFTLPQWAFAEEPYKVIWAIRNDGIMLSLTFLREQELIGWTHHDTQGLFKSVATVTETVTAPNGTAAALDAVYVIVERTVQSQTMQYIERVAERFFNGQVANAWCVDAGLQYSGSPATVFSGLDHLVGLSVTGLADGQVIPPQVVAGNGSVTLGTPASLVTIGLPFTAQLQTLRLDTGDPTTQGKRKKIPAVTVRVEDTLGLSIGGDFSSLVPMKDLVVGNVGSASNQVVTDLVTEDARTLVDPRWTVQGQYCIQQSNPMPASVLGVIPEIDVGDTPK